MTTTWNIHGGCASMEELEQLDGEETAILLIEDNEGPSPAMAWSMTTVCSLQHSMMGSTLPCYHYEADMNCCRNNLPTGTGK